MSAKIIYSFTDENPDLKKQIGCMNGIFQLFDRQHFLTGRRSSHKRLPPVGQIGNDDKQTNGTPQKAKDKNQRKEAKEKHRTSSESSRTSFSSSTCSSTFSSLDCNKIAQLEPSSTTQTISPETPSRDRDLPMNQAKLLGRQSFDLRDVVKDSINREARGLSVNPAHKEPAGHTMKHIDSPRPLQLSKPLKTRISSLNESSRALAKLREAPWNSNEAKDSRVLASRDAPRFSYDGRESREKTAIKLKELPRLSLDSRAGSMRGTSPEFKSKYLMGNQVENENTRRTVNPQEEPGSYKRPSSVVAKLMGLDALPNNSMLSNEGNMGLSKPCADQDLEPFSRSSNTANDIYQNRVSGSPRNRQQGVISPSLRNADSVMQVSSSLRIPIEPAPWKQLDGSRGSTNPPSKHLESPIKTPNSCRSVYGEIEKRLAELEFRKSGKDLRALKQILEAMQKTKETLETKQDQSSDSPQTCYSPSFSSYDHKSKLANQRNLRRTPPISSTMKQTSSPLKTSGSPIVIMKPATLVRKSGNPASAIIPIEGLSGLHKLRTGDLAHSQGTFVDKQTYKDRTPRDNLRGISNRFHCSTDKNFSTRIRTPETSKVPQQMTVESPSSSGRNSGALSPRLQRKQLTLEKQPRPTTPPSDSSRPRRQSSRHLIESNSQGRKIRPSCPNLQKNDDQLSEISSSNTRCSSHHGNAISLKSESSTSFLSQVDADVSSTGHSEEIMSTFSQQGGQKHKDSVARLLSENGSMAELATATPEQPSPVSVLDAMFYKDELPSPVKKISSSFFEDDETLNSDEPVWTSAVDLHHISDCVGSNLVEIGHTKLESIEQLVQQLRQLNSPQIETSVDCCITSLLENKNNDHKYISEILLASGLLSRDLASCLMTIQPQPTGYLLNPDLFLVLEQINTKNLSNDEHIKKISKSMPKEKIHRKLVFDAVNEILVGKLVSTGSTEPWFSGNKPARRIPNGQKLLKELCSKIDHLQDNSDSSLEDDTDFFRSMLWEDLRQQSPSWTDFGSDVSGLVLDIERLIFKDLVTEVVDGEATGIRTRLNGHCRKLFVK